VARPHFVPTPMHLMRRNGGPRSTLGACRRPAGPTCGHDPGTGIEKHALRGQVRLQHGAQPAVSHRSGVAGTALRNVRRKEHPQLRCSLDLSRASYTSRHHRVCGGGTGLVGRVERSGFQQRSRSTHRASKRTELTPFFIRIGSGGFPPVTTTSLGVGV